MTPLLIVLAIAMRSDADALERIRTTSPHIQTVLSDASEKSPTLRSIVSRIDASNVIVYLMCHQFTTHVVSGRTLFMEASGDTRYLRVEVDCMLQRPNLVMILGHELQHVAEVVDAPHVVDVRSFGKLFASIGYLSCDGYKSEEYETNAARAAGKRIREEFLHRWPVGARVVTNTRSGVPAQ